MSGIDNNCLLVLKGDGADGSTTILDSSPAARTLTRVGNVEIDNTNAAFGGTSIKFFGGHLKAADNPAFALGGSDFTWEKFVTFNSASASQYFFMQSDGSNLVYFLWYKATTGPDLLSFQSYKPSAQAVVFSRSWTPTIGVEYHIQLKKEGGVYSFKIDGVLLGTIHTDATTLPDIAGDLYLGAKSDGTGAFNGWWDEVRFSRVARADTVPPIAEYTLPAPPPPPTVGDSENAFYARRAAAMDTNSCVYVRSNTGFDIVEDHPVLLLNCWRTCMNGPSNYLYFHRPSDIDNAQVLPAGTHIKATNPVWPYAYYSDPDLVNSDPRYADGRKLWYDRLEMLTKIPMHTLQAEIPQGYTVQQYVDALAYDAQNGTNTAAPLSVAFPDDFEDGLVVGRSQMDGSWMVLETPNAIAPGIPRILNLHDEINDVQSFRGSKGNCLVPFKRSQFQRLTIGFGSVEWGYCNTSQNGGNPHIFCQSDGRNNDIVPIYPGAATFNEQATIQYYKINQLAALGFVW